MPEPLTYTTCSQLSRRLRDACDAVERAAPNERAARDARIAMLRHISVTIEVAESLALSHLAKARRGRRP